VSPPPNVAISLRRDEPYWLRIARRKCTAHTALYGAAVIRYRRGDLCEEALCKARLGGARRLLLKAIYSLIRYFWLHARIQERRG